MAEDFPAFIVNRILLPMINEAIYTLYEGVGSVEAIDTAMRLGAQPSDGPAAARRLHRPRHLLSVMLVLYEGLADSKYRPCPLLVKYVEAGWLGRKAQRGSMTIAASVRSRRAEGPALQASTRPVCSLSMSRLARPGCAGTLGRIERAVRGRDDPRNLGIATSRWRGGADGQGHGPAGLPTLARISSATSRAAASSTPAIRMANSSPPKRATTDPVRG